jgi:hypothetical protein
MTSASYAYLSPQGVIIADTSSTLATVQSWWIQALGADLVIDPATPQGVIMTTETISLNTMLNNNAALANQINPNIAGGVFLDAIGQLTGIQRQVQQPTAVTNVTIAGVAGTVLPVGAQAQTEAGDLFQLTQTTTIPSGGTVYATFQSVAYGPIPCANGALNEIVTAILGWESVTNNTGGSPASVTTLGSTTQSDQAFRAYRKNTLAFQGLSLAEAITSALYAVPGVPSLSFLENYNSVPQGMLISVTGGTTLSGTIWGMTTTSGTGTNGAIVIGTDSVAFAESDQVLPVPNPWPVAAFTTTANITLSGLGTQGGGDWGSGLSAGNIILVKNQTTASQNGLYSAESSTWTRYPGYTSGTSILGSNQGISLIASSVYACVAGGTATDVAAALLENKSSGCAWNGAVATPVIEPASGQSYTVLYDTPTELEILIEVVVTGATTDQVVQAILDYQAGTVTDPAGNTSVLQGFRVGQPVSPFEIAGAIAIENPGCYVSSVEIAINSESPSYASTPIAIGLNQQAYVIAGGITVNV